MDCATSNVCWERKSFRSPATSNLIPSAVIRYSPVGLKTSMFLAFDKMSTAAMAKLSPASVHVMVAVQGIASFSS